MKIIALEAENLKRLTAVRIEPDGNLVQITGKNGQGKTSVLDAIWWALDGKEHVQAKPVRQGEEQAIVRLDLGELIVTRKFRAKDDGSYTTSIIVENSEGARFPSPQTMLDNLLGHLTFDPLAFTRMKPDDQVHALRSLVPDFDFAAAEASIKEAFDERAICNRDAREAKAAADVITQGLPDEIPALIEGDDFEKLQSSYETALAESAEFEAKYASKEASKRRLEQIEDDLNRLNLEKERVIKAIEEIGDIPDLETSNIKIDEARQKLNSVLDNNKVAERAENRDKLLTKSGYAESLAVNLTKKIETIKTTAKDAIAKADMPVDGLSISDGKVYLDGVPFDQASDAQQLQASIGIAMAMNPTLKVVRVRDGSLLDQDAMNLLAKMADDRDYQIWIERVDSSGKIGFVLEDGHLKQAAPEKSSGGLFGGQEA